MPGSYVEDIANGSGGAGPDHNGEGDKAGQIVFPQLGQLKSDDQAALLDAIDHLRGEGIDAELSIPQIVVCGDQGSGKSSVLEAIAGLPFPSGVGTTTTFATAVILRKSTNDKIDVKIVPSPDRGEDMQDRIKGFKMPEEFAGPEHVDRAISAAEAHLKHHDPDNEFPKDWLRVEICGPEKPHLTLVDLPGMIQNDSQAGRPKGNKEKIRRMIMKYVKEPRMTVLAVINAQNDVKNQGILELLEQCKDATHRAIGVITKADDIPPDSDLQHLVIKLARNEITKLELGWHVVRNLRHDGLEDRTPTNRDAIERQFFDGAAWSEVKPSNLGISELRRKLKEQLFGTVIQDLPTLIGEMKQQLHLRQSLLDRLGSDRTTPGDMRIYLSNAMHKLRRLIETALDGHYDKLEFVSFFNGDPAKHLRDQINREIEAFALRIRTQGQQYHIHSEDCADPVNTWRPKIEHRKNIPSGQIPNFSPPYTLDVSMDGMVPAVNVSVQVYFTALAAHIRNNQGNDLPRLTTTRTVKSIFRQQSKPWIKIAQELADKCSSVTSEFLHKAVLYCTNDYTGKILLREYMYPDDPAFGFASRQTILNAKVDELLWPYGEGYFRTYNSDLRGSTTQVNENTPQKWRAIANVLRTQSPKTFTSEMVHAADDLDLAESYYSIALDTFIDNIAALGVEKCLLASLGDVFPNGEVALMDDERLAELASEPAHIRKERTEAGAQIHALNDVIGICERFVGQHRIRSLTTSSANSRSIKPTEISSTEAIVEVPNDVPTTVAESVRPSVFSSGPNTGIGFGGGANRGSSDPRGTSSGGTRSGAPSTSGGFGSPSSPYSRFGGSSAPVNPFGGSPAVGNPQFGGQTSSGGSVFGGKTAFSNNNNVFSAAASSTGGILFGAGGKLSDAQSGFGHTTDSQHNVASLFAVSKAPATTNNPNPTFGGFGSNNGGNTFGESNLTPSTPTGGARS